VAKVQVDIQNVEGNEDQTAITGAVNGVQVAAVVKTRTVPVNPAEAQTFYAQALAEVFDEKALAPSAALVEVDLG